MLFCAFTVRQPFLPSLALALLCLYLFPNVFYVAAADGNEGGRHNLITAAVGNGNLYICQVPLLMLLVHPMEAL